MRIVADENIPFAAEAFGTLGGVLTLPGRAIGREHLTNADALVVRSITRVDAALLEGTAVRFVGTATIGEDHVDRAYLAARGIRFASAPGCNANSVGEYVAAALLTLAERHGLDLGAMSIGIVGAGHTGRAAAAKAAALGMRCVLNDPPLAGATCEPVYRDLDEIQACDAVTLHVPLTREGPYPTHHLVDAAFLERMKPGAILINASRGAVVDGDALKSALWDGRIRAAALDVWVHEPSIDPDLLHMTDIATPHIAGYSFEGKVNGTVQIYRALCAFAAMPPSWDPAPLLPPPDVPLLEMDPVAPHPLSGAVRAVYDILRDDAALRATAGLAADARGVAFDRLRKTYPRRREFMYTRVRLLRPDPVMARRLSRLGFTLAE